MDAQFDRVSNQKCLIFLITRVKINHVIYKNINDKNKSIKRR